MSKSTHFSVQPLYCQVIKLLDKSKVLKTSRDKGGERYVKSFYGWAHLVVMLYAVIMRFDSLREITASLQAEARKLCHLGISAMTSRSTLADANKRRPESVFESIYRACINYEKFEQMTQRGVIYVTKMKKSLKYNILSDIIYQTPKCLMEVRIQQVTFTKQLKNGETLTHQARVITIYFS